MENKYKILCEKEKNWLDKCKKEERYCKLYEELYKDCIKFKKTKSNETRQFENILALYLFSSTH